MAMYGPDILEPGVCPICMDPRETWRDVAPYEMPCPNFELWSFRQSEVLSSQLLLHVLHSDLNETWSIRCCTTSLEVHVLGDNLCSTNFGRVMVLDT